MSTVQDAPTSHRTLWRPLAWPFRRVARVFNSRWTERRLEAGLRWLLGYPLLTGQVLLFLLLAWGVAGGELGLTDLLWHEDWLQQLSAGAATGWLFGVVLFVNTLLHGPRDLPGVAADPGPFRRSAGHHRSLFPSRDPGVRAVGNRLRAGLFGLLLVLWAGKLVAVGVAAYRIGPDDPEAWRFPPTYGLAFALGYLLSLELAYLVSLLDGSVLGVRDWLADSRLMTDPHDDALDADGPPAGRRVPAPFATSVALAGRPLGTPSTDGLLDSARPTAVAPDTPEAHNFRSIRTLHAMAVVLAGLTVGLLLLVIGFAQWVRLAPAVVLAVLLILADIAGGLFAFRVRCGRVLGVVLLAGLVLLNWAGCGRTMTLPGLEGGYAVPVKLNPDPGKAPPAHPAARTDLITGEELLEAYERRWTAPPPAGLGRSGKPPLVLVAASGGGVRAAVWAAVVLDGLERAAPPGAVGFRDQVRLIAGASGGMVGAGAYVADFGPPPAREAFDPATGLPPLARALARDALSPTVRTMLLHDFGLPAVLPVGGDWDRGRALEAAWDANFTDAWRWDEPWSLAPVPRPSPLAVRLATLTDQERKAERPSLVFSPMMAEDAKRLLVSNLDLEPLTGPTADRAGGGDNRAGLPAVELARILPAALTRRLTVGTAARMSATFPVVTPAVGLPATPERRLVDAGYFDNYGVDVLAGWLLAHHRLVRRHTAGVLVVQVRAYPLAEEGLSVSEVRRQPLELLAGSVSAPVQAVLAARGWSGFHRDAEQLDALRHLFADHPKSLPFATAVFELRSRAALSWYLTSEQMRQIGEGWSDPGRGWKVRPEVREQAEAVYRWLAGVNPSAPAPPAPPPAPARPPAAPSPAPAPG